MVTSQQVHKSLSNPNLLDRGANRLITNDQSLLLEKGRGKQPEHVPLNAGFIPYK